MMIITVLLLVLGKSGNQITLSEGVILWVAFLLYLGYLFYCAKKNKEEVVEEEAKPMWKLLLATILGLLLVVCCGAGIGVMQAMCLRQTHRNLEQLCRMLRELSVQMAFRSLTVQELLEQLCREPAYAAFQFPVLVLSGLEQGMPLADAWESGIRQDKAIPETLSQYRRQLEPYAAEAGELCRRKQRLYCSLGVLGGFLAAILLC